MGLFENARQSSALYGARMNGDRCTMPMVIPMPELRMTSALPPQFETGSLERPHNFA